jgi:tripartite-type tricarboxylate transporter receptor subunit TctC
MTRIARFLIALACLTTLGMAVPARGQGSPPLVRIVVPFGAGNPVDALARALADNLTQVAGRQFIVDNKGGGGGVIGTTEVARAKPDGSVLLFTTGTHTINTVLYRKLPYDALRDFTPITQIDKTDGFVLLVRADSPYRSVQQLVDAARAKPGAISFGSNGVGTTPHLVGELFSRAANVKLLHVPYKTTPLMDLLGGQIDMVFFATGLAQPLLQDGKLRVLAIANERRSTTLPDVPTLNELGIKNVEVPAWSGLLAPAGLPGSTAEALRQAVANAVKRSEYQTAVRALGTVPVLSSPQQFGTYLGAEVQRNKAQLTPLNIELD